VERPEGSAAARRLQADQALRRAREVSAHARRSPVGPVGRMALLVGLAALAGVLAVWLLLAA
jgi:hypothetical protein